MTNTQLKSYDLEVTPEVANEFLGKNHKNRKLSEFVVTSLANQMSRDLWHYDGSPIRFDWDGNLIDGQHRLNAIVKSGVSQTMHVVEGLDPATQVTMDTGRKRSFSDTLHMAGLDNSKALAAIVQVSYRWYVQDVRSSALFGGLGQYGSSALQRNDLLEFHELFAKDFAFAAEYAEATRRILPVPARMIGLFAWLLVQSRYKEKAYNFLERLKDGDGLEKGSPILALRNTYIGSRGEKTSKDMWRALAQGIHAWNLYVAGKEITLLRTPSVLPDPK